MQREIMLSEGLLNLIIMVQDFRQLRISENMFKHIHGISHNSDWLKETEKYFFAINKEILAQYGLCHNHDSFEKVERFPVTQEMRNTESNDLGKYKCWIVHE